MVRAKPNYLIVLFQEPRYPLNYEQVYCCKRVQDNKCDRCLHRRSARRRALPRTTGQPVCVCVCVWSVPRVLHSAGREPVTCWVGEGARTGRLNTKRLRSEGRKSSSSCSCMKLKWAKGDEIEKMNGDEDKRWFYYCSRQNCINKTQLRYYQAQATHAIKGGLNYAKS